MRGEGNGGAISPDAVNSVQAVIHNTEGDLDMVAPSSNLQSFYVSASYPIVGHVLYLRP